MRFLLKLLNRYTYANTFFIYVLCISFLLFFMPFLPSSCADFFRVYTPRPTSNSEPFDLLRTTLSWTFRFTRSRSLISLSLFLVLSLAACFRIWMFDFLLVACSLHLISSHVFFFFRFVGAVAGQSSCIMQRVGYDSRLTACRRAVVARGVIVSQSWDWDWDWDWGELKYRFEVVCSLYDCVHHDI